jgi:twitching motility protein PilT
VPMHGDGRGGLRPTASIQYTRQEATVPPMPAGGKLSRDEFHRLLRWMVEQDATDMHITPSFPPTLRADGVFQPSQGKSFTPSEVQKVLTSILTEEERRELTDNHSVDLAYGVKGLGRFRINIFRQFHGFSAAVRYIRGEVSNFENLNLPPSLATLANLKTGMLLFTGPTGSGKSTTMATLMELMNRERQLHILTLEAPIEHIFESKKCLIQQREVGTHTDSFSRGLKDALRENPDVIMVGELRDLTTVKMALTASETGHLILATMHANSCGNAISRLVDVFPDTEKAGARAMIAETLQAVVNMRLLRHAAGRGLVPAVELLRINPAAGRTIREGKMHQMKQVLSTGITDGMWPMERNLAELVMENKIEEEEGAKYAAEKSIYHQYVASFRAAMARANAPQEPEKKGFFFR